MYENTVRKQRYIHMVLSKRTDLYSVLRFLGFSILVYEDLMNGVARVFHLLIRVYLLLDSLL